MSRLFRKLLHLLPCCLLGSPHRPLPRDHHIFLQNLSQSSFTPRPSTRITRLPLFFHSPQMTNLEHKKNAIPVTIANCPQAAIFHTMAFKLSLEINTDRIAPSTKRAFLKVLYIVCRIKKKNIFFEQYARIRMDGP